jgi:peroxiredoxin
MRSGRESQTTEGAEAAQVTNRRRVIAVGAMMMLNASRCGAQRGAALGETKAPKRADFALRDLTGRIVRLSDYLGRNVVLLNFWASWCVPCAAELPQLDRLYRAHRSRGLVVLGIAMDGPETVANVASMVRRHGLTFPVLLDEETRVVGIYNPKRTAPFSVLIGRDSTVAKTREGYVTGDERAIEADVLSLLRKEPG